MLLWPCLALPCYFLFPWFSPVWLLFLPGAGLLQHLHVQFSGGWAWWWWWWCGLWCLDCREMLKCWSQAMYGQCGKPLARHNLAPQSIFHFCQCVSSSGGPSHQYYRPTLVWGVDWDCVLWAGPDIYNAIPLHLLDAIFGERREAMMLSISEVSIRKRGGYIEK